MAGSTSVDKVGKVLQDLPVDRDDVVCSFPLLAGHPHRGAAVRFRRMRLARGLLSKMASGTGLKRRWRKHAGSPEVYSLRSTPCLLPSAKSGAQPPRQRCGHLSQNGYSLSLSLSLSLSRSLFFLSSPTRPTRTCQTSFTTISRFSGICMGPCKSLPKPLDRAICSQARAICAAGIATPVSAIMTSEEGRDAFDAIRSKLKSQGTLPVHCLNSSSASSCWTRVDNQMNKQLRAQTVSHNISQDKNESVRSGLDGDCYFRFSQL